LLARLAMFFLGWALAVGAIVLQVAPDVPKTIAGWVVLIVGGPPVYLGLEWMFGAGARISNSRFSFAVLRCERRSLSRPAQRRQQRRQTSIPGRLRLLPSKWDRRLLQ
jgi:hypothetical protein